MRLPFGLDLRLTRGASAPPLSPFASTGGGWVPVVREPFTGAWQQNQELRGDTATAYFAVFACVTLIAPDIGKLKLRLVEEDADGIWTVTTNPAYSPVLRRPNRYQLIHKFIESWITSKLLHGNTYVLKQRDQRGVVNALYVLDPTRVTPLVASDGAVYYRLSRDDLSGLSTEDLVVPAREIIHDLMVPLFHPLIGVTPLYACGVSALQGMTIQSNSSRFFGAGSNPSGILTAPGPLDDATVARLKKRWEESYAGASNVGRVAVLGDNLKYEPMTMSAVDAQLIDQLKWTADTVCSAYHVPPYMIGVGPPPPYANVEPLVQQYYAQCLQALITSFENALDDGLELSAPYGTEFALEDLLLMDTNTRTQAAREAIGAGALSPDEARKRYFGLGPVAGGDTPYMQQQYYSLRALADREVPGTPAATIPPPVVAEDAEDGTDFAAAFLAVQTAALAEGLYDAG